MAENWDNFSREEEIEELRRELLALTARVDAWERRQKNLGAFQNTLVIRVSEPGADVDAAREQERFS